MVNQKNRMSSLTNRMFRAAKLDINLYQEVVEDPKASGQYLWIVVFYAMAAAVGTFGRADAATVNITLMTTLIAWYVWAPGTRGIS